MIHPIRAWNAFFFSSTSAKPLGVMRILFGLLALINLAFCAVDLEYWYTDAGLLQGDEAWVIAGPLQHSPLLFYQDPTSVRIAFVLTSMAALLMTIGFRTKLMSILFYLGMLSINNRNLVSSSGADVLLMIYSFNMMVCPVGAAYSVDAWLASRKRGTPAEPLILSWGLRLFQIQISLVYLFAAFLKSGGGLWINGSALHYVFNNSEVGRFDFSPLTAYPLLINLMTYSALAMEFSLAFFIWFRAARPYVLYVGFMLHTGILLSINIPIFGELMWIGYLAFLTPPELAGFLKAIDVRRFLRRAEPNAAKAPPIEPTPDSTPRYRPATIYVRYDGPSGLAGTHRIDVVASRTFDEEGVEARA